MASKTEPSRRSKRDLAMEKLYAAETEALREAELTLTRQQLSDAVFEPFRRLIKQHRSLLRQSMKLTLLSDSTQNQLRTTTRDLSVALARVESLNASLKAMQTEREEVFAMAIHDFKTPLSGMYGLATILADGEATLEEVPTFGRDILQLSEGMLGAVNELVDLHRFEEGSVHLKREAVSLADLAESIRSSLGPAAKRKHIRLLVSAADQTAHLDAEIVLRVVGNLASNAVKFSPAGGAVSVNLIYEKTKLYVEVTDQGPGISVADQKKLFQKFARLTARPTGGESSSGLGLAIVKRLVELHGGNVTCKSALGVGSTFRVVIPISEPST